MHLMEPGDYKGAPADIESEAIYLIPNSSLGTSYRYMRVSVDLQRDQTMTEPLPNWSCWRMVAAECSLIAYDMSQDIFRALGKGKLFIEEQHSFPQTRKGSEFELGEFELDTESHLPPWTYCTILKNKSKLAFFML